MSELGRQHRQQNAEGQPCAVRERRSWVREAAEQTWRRGGRSVRLSACVCGVHVCVCVCVSVSCALSCRRVGAARARNPRWAGAGTEVGEGKGQPQVLCTDANGPGFVVKVSVEMGARLAPLNPPRAVHTPTAPCALRTDSRSPARGGESRPTSQQAMQGPSWWENFPLPWGGNGQRDVTVARRPPHMTMESWRCPTGSPGRTRTRGLGVEGVTSGLRQSCEEGGRSC